MKTEHFASVPIYCVRISSNVQNDVQPDFGYAATSYPDT